MSAVVQSIGGAEPTIKGDQVFALSSSYVSNLSINVNPNNTGTWYYRVVDKNQTSIIVDFAFSQEASINILGTYLNTSKYRIYFMGPYNYRGYPSIDIKFNSITLKSGYKLVNVNDPFQ